MTIKQAQQENQQTIFSVLSMEEAEARINERVENLNFGEDTCIAFLNGQLTPTMEKVLEANVRNAGYALYITKGVNGKFWTIGDKNSMAAAMEETIKRHNEQQATKGSTSVWESLLAICGMTKN